MMISESLIKILLYLQVLYGSLLVQLKGFHRKFTIDLTFTKGVNVLSELVQIFLHGSHEKPKVVKHDIKMYSTQISFKILVDLLQFLYENS